MKLTKYNRFPASFRFFDDAVTRSAFPHRPAVNIVEEEAAYRVELLAPGRNKDLFQVDFHEGILEVSYTTEKTGEEVAPNYLRNEFSLQDFSRRFQLNRDVINDEAIEATYTDGILRLTLPKRAEVLKPARQIAVA